MKILVFNKVKKGLTYENACIELEQEIDQIIANDVKTEDKTKYEKKKDLNETFKEEFSKLTNGRI